MILKKGRTVCRSCMTSQFRVTNASVVTPHPHQSDKLETDPDPHQSDKIEPDPDPHQSDKQDPDPDPQH
jgi:hypothetical protein